MLNIFAKHSIINVGERSKYVFAMPQKMLWKPFREGIAKKMRQKQPLKVLHKKAVLNNVTILKKICERLILLGFKLLRYFDDGEKYLRESSAKYFA